MIDVKQHALCPLKHCGLAQLTQQIKTLRNVTYEVFNLLFLSQRLIKASLVIMMTGKRFF